MLPSLLVPPDHWWTAVVVGIGDSLTHEQGFLPGGPWGQDRMVAVRSSRPSDLVAVHSVGLSPCDSALGPHSSSLSHIFT